MLFRIFQKDIKKIPGPKFIDDLITILQQFLDLR